MNTIIKTAVKVGNSSGVILPREYLGSKVKIVLLEKKISIGEIKRETLKLLNDHLDDLMGIYLYGSYARGEERADSDIDILAVSNKINKNLNVGRYNIMILSLDRLREMLESNIVPLGMILSEACSIINARLLGDLREKITLNRKNLRWHFETTKSIINVLKKSVELEDDRVKSSALSYSLVLRLREAYMVGCLLTKKKYLHREFEEFLGETIKTDSVKAMIEVYRAEKAGKKIVRNIDKKEAILLIKLLEDIIKKQENEIP